jgi:hypothetical protein
MDDNYTVVDLSFTFVYFGKSYTQISISSNGYVCFGENEKCTNNKEPLTDDILIGLYYDLDTKRNGSGQIYYKNLNDSTMASLYVNLLDPSFVPKNIFMITYDNVLPYLESGSDSPVSFQIYILTDSIKSYVIFKYTSCPDELSMRSSGLNINKKEEISIPKSQKCSLSNVKQKGVWVSQVNNYSTGKYKKSFIKFKSC